jgi:hypothetical protein
MKITFESAASYSCMASYHIIADCGDVVSVRREVLVTIAPHHTFFFFVLSPSSHNTSSRRPDISSIASVVQNGKAWRQFTNTSWDATQDHESCDRTCSYSDRKFLSHELGIGQSQNHKWRINCLFLIIRMVHGLTWQKEEDSLLDSTYEQNPFRFPKRMCCPVANGSHASHKTVYDISSRQSPKYALANFV